ncbi:hypothetical protein [Salinarchaeum laminariae]|uniref:hypothetical protein n=1 Tax=Salinarchaeum laminariae TaxID=869888 RepID=UPI0020C0E0E2|nr:hypothetical protein [Salinarchaeum laminariae]
MHRSPSRRAFAALAATAVAGCLSVPNRHASNDEPANESDPDDNSGLRDRVQTNCTTSMASPDPYPDLQIEYDDVPEDAGVAMCVQAVQPFTDDSPAKIAVELTNVSDSSATYGFGISPPWGGVFAEHVQQEATLIFVPDYREHVGSEGLIPQRATDGCWRAQSLYSGEDIGLTATVDPAETIREEYTILAAEGSACLTQGTYRSEEAHYDPVPDAWGFDITLSA